MHRDLKMDNVMVASDGRAVLADFGTAVRVRSDGSVQLRQGQSVGGNTAHLAPEVNDAASRIAHESHETAVHVPYGRQSVFALGVLMTELATGEHPIPGYPSSVEVRSGGDGHATGGRRSRFAYRLPSGGDDGVNPSDCGGRADGDVSVVVEDVVELPEEYPAALRALSRRMLSCDPAARPRLGAVVTALEASLANAGGVGNAQCANCAHMRMQVALLEDQVAALQATNARLAADNARFTAAANGGDVVTPRDVNAEVDSGTDGNNGYSGVDAEAVAFLSHVQRLDTLLSACDDTGAQCGGVTWEEGVASLERLLQAADEARLSLYPGDAQPRVVDALDAFTTVLRPADNLSKYHKWRSAKLQLTQRGAAALVRLVKHSSGTTLASVYLRCMVIVGANAANKVSIAEAGGIAPVVAALIRHGGNSGVCESACGALRSLGVQYRQ